MTREFRLPDLGEGVTEGQIVRVLIAEGDTVREDQPLMEVETDKASVEIPSPFAGVVAKVHVAEAQVVNVGDVMVTFSGDGPVRKAPAAAARSAPASRSSTGSATATAARPPAARAGRHTPASPAVRRLARQMGVDLDAINGSGPGGRVTRDDVQKAASAGAPAAAPRSAPRTLSPATAPAAPHAAGTPGTDHWGPIETVPLTRARKTIAETMARSVATIPQATDTDDADITDLDRLRRGWADPGGAATKLTILPFVIRATALALQRHPLFNASYDAEHEQIVYHRYVSVAIGVHTDRGLIAPVLRDVDRQSIPQLAGDLAALADKARTASFEVNDTRGGTFTISNAGAAGGSRYSTPLVNPPQAAILALGRSRWQPWVVGGTGGADGAGGTVTSRLILPLSLSFDHRLIDGADEVHFMQEIIALLENPARLLL